MLNKFTSAYYRKEFYNEYRNFYRNFSRVKFAKWAGVYASWEILSQGIKYAGDRIEKSLKTRAELDQFQQRETFARERLKFQQEIDRDHLEIQKLTWQIIRKNLECCQKKETFARKWLETQQEETRISWN